MTVQSGDQSLSSSIRGQSTVLGVVLLIGMVAVGSTALFLVASSAITDAEQQSEQEQIEQGFVEMSNSISSAITSGDTTDSMELDAGEHGAVAHHDSATYDIWTENLSSDEEETNNVTDGSIGTIEYEDNDGTKVAYEGGAVFRETGEETELLSEPSFDYDHGTNTLSFPVTTLTEEQSINSGDIQINQNNSSSEDTNYVEDHKVFITIESEYCLGWEQYFADQAGDTTVQESCFNGDNDDGEVKIILGYGDIDDAFSSGVALPDERYIGESGGGHGITDLESTSYMDLDNVIENLIDDFNDNATTEFEDENNSGGEYYIEDFNETYDFSLEDDDAIVVVNDTVDDTHGDIELTECGDGENSLRIYADGNFSFDNPVHPSGECDSDEAIQLYGTSSSIVEFHDSGGSEDHFRGLIYVAGDEYEPGDFDSNNPDEENYQVRFTGGGGFDYSGAIVANSIYFGSNADDVTPEGTDASEIEIIPEGYEPAPQLTYLNIAEHEIEIQNE